MTQRNGEPCKRCGTSDWYRDGKCKECRRILNQSPAQKKAKREHEKTLKRISRRDTSEYKEYHRLYEKSEKRVRYLKSEKRKSIVKAFSSKRRSRVADGGGSFTHGEWDGLKKHYENRCLCCGKSDIALTADHVVPVFYGGSSNIDNIQPLCQSCNSSKGTKKTDYRSGGFLRWIQKKLF